jgi:acidic leucine-rich nuclear phosphoprotein 32 family protein A/C/D
VECLSFNSAGLKSLKNFPQLENLVRIELSDNKISGGLEDLVKYTKLDTLKLGGNNIKDLETLNPLVPIHAHILD